MTIQQLQGIVLRLSNQLFVRHYLWLNYPNDPQIMGIQFQSTTGYRAARRSVADLANAGECSKCRHREAMRLKYRTHQADSSFMLVRELESLGFAWREDLKLWAIERTEANASTTAGVNE